MHKTIIFRVLDAKETSMKSAAVECNKLFKKAKSAIKEIKEPEKKGKVEKDVEPIKEAKKEIIEETFGLCNTPMQNGYIRVVVDEEFIAAIGKSSAAYTQNMELVLIEHGGQTEFVTAEYDDPILGHVRELLGYMAELPIL